MKNCYKILALDVIGRENIQLSVYELESILRGFGYVNVKNDIMQKAEVACAAAQPCSQSVTKASYAYGALMWCNYNEDSLISTNFSTYYDIIDELDYLDEVCNAKQNNNA